LPLRRAGHASFITDLGIDLHAAAKVRSRIDPAMTFLTGRLRRILYDAIRHDSGCSTKFEVESITPE